MDRIEKTCDELVLWLRNKVKEANSSGVVFGLSGGVDSAVIAGISKLAFPDTSLGVIMPCNSNPVDEEHGLLVADSLDLETKKVELSKTYNILMESLDSSDNNNLARANVKPRLRMTSLYYLAQKNNYLVLGGTNKSEFTVGYFTKHGDSGVDLLPIANFVKKDIWKMAEYLNIPQEIINKPPTAGLWEDQTDEDEMGFSYDDLDSYIIDGKGQEDIVKKIQRMNENSKHKRSFPPIFRPKNEKI